ncbi:S1/P1 nuclease [Hyaloscypha bicolor E]|uniref:S1/P1 nuclease n=1 Tax=Hyaloscypha bicolor E TaxID=1095630 RepID=A0A2J6TIU2_9HELO|nr:S1/P1 nuclease [Hyaloscypha bicolor E]PMD62936.1 S1/P1 nuclease [Hyaloscypha bicolor E]
MKLTLTTPSLLLLSSAHQALAWGTLGHETVAFIAQNFVAADTKVFLSSILQDTSTEYLAKVATWADSFRYTKAGKFSEPFHFIDAEDNPPDSCSVTYSRDCGKSGCVVGAIQNYTTQLLDSSLDKGTINMAAKKQFVGDIHQPLHDEALDRGGNSIAVLFGGVATNLHHIWDTNMPEKLVGGYTLADAERWAATLTTEINTGAFKDQAASWLEGIDITDPVTTSLGWASQTNQFVCTTVLPNGKEGVENQELSGSYYEAAVPVIQLQIARAGYRLAKWLDLITVGVRTEL